MSRPERLPIFRTLNPRAWKTSFHSEARRMDSLNSSTAMEPAAAHSSSLASAIVSAGRSSRNKASAVIASRSSMRCLVIEEGIASAASLEPGRYPSTEVCAGRIFSSSLCGVFRVVSVARLRKLPAVFSSPESGEDSLSWGILPVRIRAWLRFDRESCLFCKHKCHGSCAV